jgi:hypothetical protein
MSNLTPFEIRLELLKMAKEMLEQDYYAHRERITNEWSMRVDLAKINGGEMPDPPYPSESDVIAKAQTLNGFVSNIQQTTIEKTSKKSL